TWMEAFGFLANLLKSKRVRGRRLVVFIDELPCFDTQNARFVHALDYFWNSKGSWMDNIFFVVCGSATSWMIKNVIDNHGGLHNRITHEIHLRPFDLKETEVYLKSRGVRWNRLSIVQIYMALGGVPYYLGMLDKTKSVAENIDLLFFSDDAELRKEYPRLFKSLFKDPENYVALINALAGCRQGLTRKEIAQMPQFKDNGHLTEMLENLVNCDFIRIYNNGTKQNGSIYQLTDFYTLFYNKFCKKRTTDDYFWRKHIDTTLMNNWHGLAFERVCMYHFRNIIRALRLDAIHTEFYSWRSRNSEHGAQIDIVIDRSDNVISICEVKYSQSDYLLKKSEYEKILNRIGAFSDEKKGRKAVQPVLITTFKLKQNEYSDIFQRALSLDDLFE
ncbi:MAG: ATP-binding protein, partial [Bacteroidales bacterium]|nr:ATP-binding protein [Bacteroidales bacterium]